MSVKVAVIYYSTYGTNHQMAEAAAEAAREAGAEVRLRKAKETAPKEVVEAQEKWSQQAKKTADIPEATPDDMVWADAYIFSAPTRYGGAASQMRSFIDTLGPIWNEGKLADKVVTAMTSAGNPHGGQETTLQTLYYTFMHWGCIIVTPGYTDQAVFDSGGNPYGMSVTAGDELSDSDRAGIAHQAKRLVQTAERFAR
ncbi:MAG TPA: NAD(P)H:quinone oxidoreductase [Longimicrobiales bacterium]|nr:NAD(P)H:quinone oxidoreductase [Longimicrobiales bacterium]